MKLRKYLSIPLGVGLAFAIGLAGAQVINKALQLSQDATGAFGVDTNQGVYFPGHLLNTGAANPVPTVISSAGSPTVSGTDFAGTITAGTSSTGVNLTFGRAYVSTPTCLVTWRGPNTVTPISYATFPTGVALTQGSTSSNKVDYICTGPN
jgi:hypothetical protein